jgi:hypothetical protein
MIITNGWEYYVDGHKDVEKFAKGILTLVNLRSSRRGTVIDLRTFEGINQVYIITASEFDADIERIMGEITAKNPINIANLDRWEDGNEKLPKKMEKFDDDYFKNDDGIQTIYYFESEDID